MDLLLIEDNDDDVTLIRALLADVDAASVEIDTAKRLTSGLKKLAANPPDAVLLDLGLPDSFGLATFEAVYAAASHTPIIVFSGSDDIDVATRSVSQGAQDYLVKGQVDGSSLLRAIRYAIERKAAEKKIHEQQQRINALNRITAAITTTLDPAQVLRLLAENIDAFLPYSAGAIWLVNQETGQLERNTCWNIDEKKWKKLESDEIPPNLQPLVDERCRVYVRNMQSDAHAQNVQFFKSEQIVSYLALPLVVHDQLLGMITFLTRQEHEFPQEEIGLLENLAGKAAIAIHNAQLYARTQSQTEQLAKTNRTMADMTAMIAHDLRAPLMNIIGLADMMADGFAGPVPEEQKKWLSSIAGSGRGMVELVKDFLDVSIIEAGHINLKPASFDVAQLINEVVENFRLSARRKSVELLPQLGAPIAPLVADRRRIEQVLNNLLSNAIKFSHAGGRVEIRAAREGKTAVRIEVADQGVGIAPKELAQLFRKYSQGSKNPPSEQGTGLGLVICKMIVEAHHGKIWIESKEGIGSTIYFTLPRGD